MISSRGYRVGATITGLLAFVIGWIYAVSNYGFFLGVGLGWFPSAIIAIIAALLWPIIALGVFVVFACLFFEDIFNQKPPPVYSYPATQSSPTRPPEFFTYMKILESHTKKNWRWEDTKAALVAQVQIEIAPDGTVKSVVIRKTSSNSNYDDAVVDAVKKSSPVPPAPDSVYKFFKSVLLTFDPRL